MALQTVIVGDLIFVRWTTPSAAACAELRATVARRRKTKPYCVLVFPEQEGALGSSERDLLVELTRGLMPSCAHMAAVIEARGVRGASLQATLSNVRSATSQHYGLSIVGSIDRALSWAPGPVPNAAELCAVFEEDRHELVQQVA